MPPHTYGVPIKLFAMRIKDDTEWLLPEVVSSAVTDVEEPDGLPVTFSFWPAKIKSELKLFKDLSLLTDVPNCLLMPDNVSPLLTVYVAVAVEPELPEFAAPAVPDLEEPDALLPVTFSFCPAKIKSELKLFKDLSLLTDVPNCLLMPDNVSPLFTVYVVVELELPAGRGLLLELDGVAEPAPLETANTSPGWISDEESLFQLIKFETDMPWFKAIALNVSPDLTVYVLAEEDGAETERAEAFAWDAETFSTWFG